MGKDNTPYDDAYKTMLEKFPQLIIPLVNEQFHKDYPLDAKVENLNLESHAKDKKVVADSVFKICEHYYHVECQSNPDGTIAVRMLEYDFYIGMKEIRKNEDGIYEMTFPKSCVIYLRHNDSTEDEMKVKVNIPGQVTFTYVVPIIKAQEYSLDEICEKKLFLLLPFYIIRYEDILKKRTKKDFSEGSSEKEELERLVKECETIVERMEQAFWENDEEGRRLCAELEEIMKHLADMLCEDNENAKKKIGGAIMGGTAWKTLGERIEEAEQEKAQAEQKRAQAEQERARAEQEKAQAEQEKAQVEQKNRMYKSFFIEHLGEQEIADKESLSVEEVREILELDLLVKEK